MALVAELDMELVLGRVRDKRVAAGAANLTFNVIGMDSFFHELSYSMPWFPTKAGHRFAIVAQTLENTIEDLRSAAQGGTQSGTVYGTGRHAYP